MSLSGEDDDGAVNVHVLLAVNDSDLTQMVKGFMRDLDRNGQSIIGFDALWTCSSARPISHFLLCNGDNCIVLPLEYFPTISDSVLAFLRQPELTFVGMGIRDNLAKLDKLYDGVGCKNAVELGPLAAEVTRNPRLKSCGIDLLSKGIRLPEAPKPWVWFPGMDGRLEICSNYNFMELFKYDREELSRGCQHLRSLSDWEKIAG